MRGSRWRMEVFMFRNFKQLCASVLVAGSLASVVPVSPVQAQTIQLPDSLYTPGDTITWVKKVAGFNEGPVWDAATGYLYFTRQTLGSSQWPIYRIKPGVDTGMIWVASPGKANGLDLDPQGRLIAAQSGRITRYKQDGSVDSTLVLSGANSVTFGDANDLAIGSTGAMFFTTYSSTIYYLSASRQLVLAYSGASNANGIEWIEEDSAIYVNELRLVKRYKVNANGTVSNPQTFITVYAGSGSGGTYADGGAIDAHGNRYIAAQQIGDIKIYNARGDSIGRITPKSVVSPYETGGFSGGLGNVSNIIFGGADLKTMYFVGDGGLYSIPMKIPGRIRMGYPGGPTGIRFHEVSGRTSRLPMKLLEKMEQRDLRGRLLSEEAHGPVLNRVPITK
jgi:sugar lactone lactonase YvrE